MERDFFRGKEEKIVMFYLYILQGGSVIHFRELGGVCDYFNCYFFQGGHESLRFRKMSFCENCPRRASVADLPGLLSLSSYLIKCCTMRSVSETCV